MITLEREYVSTYAPALNKQEKSSAILYNLKESIDQAQTIDAQHPWGIMRISGGLKFRARGTSYQGGWACRWYPRP